MKKVHKFALISTLIIILQIIFFIVTILYIKSNSDNLTESFYEKLLFKVSFIYPFVSVLNIGQIIVNIFWYTSIFENQYNNTIIILCIIFVMSFFIFAINWFSWLYLLIISYQLSQAKRLLEKQKIAK